MAKIKETISGVDIEGGWEEIIDKSRRVSEVLEDIVGEEEVEAWNRWRPKEKEKLDREVRDKTVGEAEVKEGPVEREGRTAKEEAGEAVQEAEKAVKGVKNGEGKKAPRRMKKSSQKFAFSFDAVARKVVRRIQKTIYTHVISKTNRQYFDSETVSASLGSENGLIEDFRGKKDREYILSVSINDDKILEKFKSEFLEGNRK